MSEIILKNVSKRFLPERSTYEYVFLALSKNLTRNLTSKMNNKTISPETKEGFYLKNINLKIPDGLTTVILGPSGCGKSTLLKLVAGLISPDCGSITYDNIDVSSIKPKDRKIGMVFENYALYPGFEVEKNILSRFIFSEKVDRLIKKERLLQTSKLLEIDIKHLIGKFPSKLSGGEKQRVALGRCITRDPELFLLDEPFSNLDAHLREKYRINLKKLLKMYSITTLYVTHDQKEAILMGDKIVIMNNGEIVQEGSFEELYNNPGNIFVAEFINPFSEIPSLIKIHGENISEKYRNYIIGIRPDRFEISLTKKEGFLSGEIFFVTFSPITSRQLIGIKFREEEFIIFGSKEIKPKKGDQLYFKPLEFFAFDARTEKCIQKEEI